MSAPESIRAAIVILPTVTGAWGRISLEGAIILEQTISGHMFVAAGWPFSAAVSSLPAPHPVDCRKTHPLADPLEPDSGPG